MRLSTLRFGTAASTTTSSMMTGGDETTFSGVTESASFDSSGDELDVNNDGVVDGEDTVMLAEIIDAGGPQSMAPTGGSTTSSMSLCPPLCPEDCPPNCPPDPDPCEDLGFYARVADVYYDYSNQMIEYEAWDINTLCEQTSSLTHEYVYDVFGRRLMRTVNSGHASEATLRYVPGGQALWQILEEYDGADVLRASFVWGNYIDEVLTMRRDTDLDGTVEDYWFHQDDLFNVTAITDSGANLVEYYDYGTYGAPKVYNPSGIKLSSGSAYGNVNLWNGREYDGETRLYYYRTRYLEPTMGRFTTRDVIGVWGDLLNVGNGLNYVGSSPWVWVDPFGLSAESDAWDDSGYQQYVDDYLKEWLEWLRARETDGEQNRTVPSQSCIDRLKCVIRAISWVESRHGQGVGNHPDRDPMQCGNTNDSQHRSITGDDDQPGPRREGDLPGVPNYDDLPERRNRPYPSGGHDDPEFGPDDSFYWGIPWYLLRTNQTDETERPRGAWNLGDCSWNRLIDGAVRYNGGGDPDYRNKIEDALSQSGCR